MKEKNIALTILSLVVIIAIVGLLTSATIHGNASIKGLITDKDGDTLHHGIKGSQWRMPDGETIRAKGTFYRFVVAKTINGIVIGHGEHDKGTDDYYVKFYSGRINQWINDKEIIIETGYFDNTGHKRNRLYYCTTVTMEEMKRLKGRVNLTCDIESLR